MSECMKLLEKALTLVEQELQDMSLGDIESAEEKVGIRNGLMDKAWELRDSVDKEQFKLALMKIHKVQEELIATSFKLKDVLRSQLSESRKQNQRLGGYRKAVEQAMVVEFRQ